MELSFEDQLKKRIRKRRIIESLLCILFIAVIIGFTVAFEKSKVIEEIDFGFYKYQSVSYQYDWGYGVLAGALGLCVSGIFLLVDLLMCKLSVIDVGSDRLILDRGLRDTLYVNQIPYHPHSAHYLEAPLPDGTTLTVSLGKFHSHISFSDGRPAIDL